MYLDAFRLARAPFDARVDIEFVYVGAEQQETLKTLGQACAEEDTLTLLTAPDGCGKSALIERFIADLDEGVVWSEVRGRWTDPLDFLRAVLQGFGFEDCAGRHEQLRHILEVFLGHQRRRGALPVLIVEDAQNLSPKVLDEVRWLAGLQCGKRTAVNVVLSGLPGLERIVRAPAMDVLSARCRHRLQVKALGEAETAAYIQHRLTTAGALDPARVFEPAAIELIHRYTGGVPGLINTLCQTAMSCAAAAGENWVDAATVESAAAKLHVVYDSGVTRVQGMRSTDAKAIRQDELARLIVTRDDEAPREFRIKRERLLIGRKPGNDLQLDGRGVSRHHAMMLLDADGWWLIDLHSRNGTYVNSCRIQQQRIRHNDIIQIADFRIRCLHRMIPAALPAPAEDEPGARSSGGETVEVPAITQTAAPDRPPGGRSRPRLVKSS